MQKILEEINRFVNGALGPILGSKDGYDWGEWIRDFLIQFIAFIILIVIIRFFLWKPLTAYLAKKAEATDQTLIEAKQIKEKNEELNKELQEKFDNAQNEIKEMLAKASLEGQRKREEIINDAKEEARRRIELAEEQIALEIKRQKEDIKQEIVDIAFLAAAKIAEKEVDKKKYLQLVENIIESGLKDE